MDKQPTEARQDELAGIREKVAPSLALKLYKWFRDYPEVTDAELLELWNDDQQSIRNLMLFRAGRIFNDLFSLTVSSGGMCPECEGNGYFIQEIAEDRTPNKEPCPPCNGTGHADRTHTLLEWVKLGMQLSLR